MESGVMDFGARKGSVVLEESLVVGILKNDQASIRQLVECYLVPQLNVFFGRKPSSCRKCLDDMSQETVVELCKDGQWRPLRRWLDNTPRAARLTTYLKTIVIRTVRRKCAPCRSDSVRSHPLGEVAAASITDQRDVDELTRLVLAERRSLLLKAIQKLPNEQSRRAIVLFFFHGLSVGEVAEQIGTSENNVSKMKQRALEKLKEILRPTPSSGGVIQ